MPSNPRCGFCGDAIITDAEDFCRNYETGEVRHDDCAQDVFDEGTWEIVYLDDEDGNFDDFDKLY